MSRIDLYRSSMVPVEYDTLTGELIPKEDVIIEERPVRMLSDMWRLFKLGNEGLENRSLYFMYNGVCLPEHKKVFDKYNMKFEYTMLLPDTIQGEYYKAHGHIHYSKSNPEKGLMETFEVLHGKGYFLLFDIASEKTKVILVDTKVGDRFTIPKEYYHLTINTGDEPFIFSDIICKDNAGNYNLLKERQGAPLFVFKDNAGGIRYEWNINYSPVSEILLCNSDTLPWKNMLPNNGPLYTSFLSEPHKFDFLSTAY
jgi:oxalate decarboxylase/phosphoglucose isomerase-like protein (cupin superfamily)